MSGSGFWSEAQHRPAAGLSRRNWMRLTALGVLGGSSSGWLPALAADAARHPQRRRSCILLWMTGGPSQLDTFDPKPGHPNGGPIAAIDTAVAGLRISEHLPQVAQSAESLAVIRSMSTREGDHARATYLMRTGYLPQGPVQYPTLGSLVSKELGPGDAELPNYVSIAPYRFLSPAAFSPGFLGPRHAPLVVGGGNAARAGGENYERALEVRNLTPPDDVTPAQAEARLDLLAGLDAEFAQSRPGTPVQSHLSAYEQAVRMTRSEAVQAFSLDDEPAELRDAYGRNAFGQGCLLARRLVEREVPFVEVSLSGVSGNAGLGWDTHLDNFNMVQRLCGILDPAWATLIRDLKDRGLLDSTLIVWMGEFGRTPQINANTGRDHFPAAWTTVLCGGGIRGGQVVGRTSDDGMTVEDRPVSVGDLLATVITALGLDPLAQNMSNVGRPIRLADPEATAIQEVL